VQLVPNFLFIYFFILNIGVIVMIEKLVEWTVLAGEIEVLGESRPRPNFVRHKSHLPDPGANRGRRGGKLICCKGLGLGWKPCKSNSA
jgi:hypothetical protein